MCSLMKHITQKKEQAWIKREHHEVMRLTREERDHRNRCPVCAGLIVRADELLVQFFGGRDVYVVGES